ncbi:hypothetical protein DFH08DRAFT_817960 [Mycena albidolilacea]|uniref:Uncharacterized protein n=1 Tax=Mycena albidolilacea TaxID=1033008 RepID=A0AAD6ZGY0_9AGAR|nr:hypothetical protein DFH08DRAFT_817960 [Mycena albidolilacea]
MAGLIHLVQVPDLEKRIHRYRSEPSTFTRTSVVSLLVVSGLILLFIVNAAFPAFMQYQVIIRSLITRHPRKRRRHWSFITPCQWCQYFVPEDRLFSIFICGILTTTIVLNSKYCFSFGGNKYHCYYFETVESFPRILYLHQTIQQAGIKPDSHIYVQFPLLGGVKSSSAAMDIDSENCSSSCQRRQTKNSKKYAEAIDAEKLDENGLPTTCMSAPQQLADSLPSKTILTTSKHHKASGSKEKAPGKKRAQRLPAEEDSSSPLPTANSAPSTAATKDKGASDNFVLCFFFIAHSCCNSEQVDSDADGTVEEDTKYYKCWHGNQKVVKITKKMCDLTGHLQRTFPAHFRLCEVLNKHGGSSTAEEIQITNSKKVIDTVTVKKYLQELDNISHNIKFMLEQQIDESPELWDQKEVDTLIAKWIATCDQPFSTVEEPEFHAMLEYAYYHRSSEALKILD